MDRAELLKVLKLTTEEQQIKRLFDLGYTEYFAKRRAGDAYVYRCRIGSLADLAFRLRDEAEPIELANSIALVYVGARLGKARPTAEALLGWLIKEAKPLHWIIAALIAKEQ